MWVHGQRYTVLLVTDVQDLIHAGIYTIAIRPNLHDKQWIISDIYYACRILFIVSPDAATVMHVTYITSYTIRYYFSFISTCVGARDPYCVWSNEILQCVQSPLTASGSAYGTVNDTLWVLNTAQSSEWVHFYIHFTGISRIFTQQTPQDVIVSIIIGPTMCTWFINFLLRSRD